MSSEDDLPQRSGASKLTGSEMLGSDGANCGLTARKSCFNVPKLLILASTTSVLWN